MVSEIPPIIRIRHIIHVDSNSNVRLNTNQILKNKGYSTMFALILVRYQAVIMPLILDTSISCFFSPQLYYSIKSAKKAL